MEKPAPADHPIHQLIAERWSPRAFDSRPVEPDKLRAVFEAARWAPSCFNDQPWRYLLATKEETGHYGKLFSCLSEANQVWVRNAPVIFCSVANESFSRNEKFNRWAQHDLGMANQNLALQATALGLSVHFMGGFSAEKVRDLCGIPENCVPVAMGALGYMGDPKDLPKDLREREAAERTRNPLEEMIFSSRWGTVSSLIPQD